MAVAVVRRLTTTLLLAGAALASVGAAPAEERGGGRARSAVIGAVVGLVLALSAKGVAVALLSGIVPIP